MAFKKYLVDLDLSKNQLLNAVVQNLASAPSSPSDGQIYWDTAQSSLFVYKAGTSTWIDLGASGVTNLGYTAGVSNGTVTSNTGTDATIPLTDATNAGLFSAAQKTKLDGIATGAEVNVGTDIAEGTTSNTTVTVTSSTGSNATLNSASTSRAGLMSKAKFDEVEANNAKVSNVDETLTSLSASANILTYTDENGNDTDIDLSVYIDDTNLSRLTSGSINGSTGVATFTRDDATTFTIDMSAFLDAITLNNTLTSTSTTEGLTAAQGKVLKDLIDALPTTDTNTQLSDGDISAFGYVKAGDLSVTQDCAAATSTTVSHTLGQYVNVSIYKKTSPFNQVEAQVETLSATSTRVTFNTAPSAGEYVIVLKG